MDARVGFGTQVGTIGDQHTVGLAGIGVERPLQAITAQALKIGLSAGQYQGGFTPRRVTDHAHLVTTDIRSQQRVGKGCGNRGTDLQWSPIKVAQGAQAAVIVGVVARMGNRHHHKTATRQCTGQIMQGQRRTGIAVRQHQQWVAANGNRRTFIAINPIAVNAADARGAAGRIERQCVHRPPIQRVGEDQTVQADVPVLRWLGLRHACNAKPAQQPQQRDFAHLLSPFPAGQLPGTDPA
ncbi:hypothetical protein D3C72_1566580 [compost metagenome]